MSTAHAARPRASGSRRLALLIVIAFATTTVATFALPTPALAWDENAFSSGAEHDLVALTNQSRAAAGRRALKVSSTLSSIARWRSKDMIKRDYFSHSIPGYGKVFKKIGAEGFCYKVAGENIGWTSESDSKATARIHDMFMGSSGHRSNILGKAWDVIGIGAYKGADGKKMYTVLFADKCGTKAKPTVKPKPKPKPKPQPKPDPKPKATHKPKPKPTPVPTPEPTPVAISTLRPEPTTDATAEPPGPMEPVVSAGPAPPDDETDPPALGATSLRVVDRGGAPGLFDAIVGRVAGFLFGA